MNPYKHSLIDEYKYNINPEDSIHVHTYMDSSKMICGDNRHRVFFHNSYFPYISHHFFGYTIKNKFDKEISIKDITEQSHIFADFNKRFIPTIADYFEDFKTVGDEEELIEKFYSRYCNEFTEEQKEFLKFPLKATGKIHSLLLTHNQYWLLEVMPKIFKDYKPKLQNFDINPSIVTDRLYFHSWINNGLTLPNRLKPKETCIL